MDVAGTAEILRVERRIGERTDGGGAVVGRNSGGAPGEKIDGDGEGGAEHRGVLLDLMVKAELLAAAYGERSAKLATGIGDHEVDMLGGDLLGRDDEVALILTVFVVDHDNKLSPAECLDGFGDGVKLYLLFHFRLLRVE